jgi:hypothetical protein
MKFEPRDFDFNELRILERFKDFLNRKFGTWLEDAKFKPMTLNQGYFKIQGVTPTFYKNKILYK